MNARPDHPALLAQYVGGDLDPGQQQAIALHLAECVECRQESEALKSMRASLLLEEAARHVGSEELVDYEEGRLARDPGRRSQVERHLERCAACRLDLRALEGARRAQESSPDGPEAAAVASETVAAAWRSPRAWGLVAAAGAAALAIWSGLFLRIAPGPDRAPSHPMHVDFAPPRRGGTDERLLPGGGPWSVTVLLPFGAPEGTYRLQIERADDGDRRDLREPIATDGQGRLTILIGPLIGGRYRLLVDPQGSTEGEPVAYPFEVVPRTPPPASKRAP